jgi:hypothetical protein
MPSSAESTPSTVQSHPKQTLGVFSCHHTWLQCMQDLKAVVLTAAKECIKECICVCLRSFLLRDPLYLWQQCHSTTMALLNFTCSMCSLETGQILSAAPCTFRTHCVQAHSPHTAVLACNATQAGDTMHILHVIAPARRLVVTPDMGLEGVIEDDEETRRKVVRQQQQQQQQGSSQSVAVVNACGCAAAAAAAMCDKPAETLTPCPGVHECHWRGCALCMCISHMYLPCCCCCCARRSMPRSSSRSALRHSC